MANEELRILPQYVQTQRGCQYCLHVTTTEFEGRMRTACPFEKCPFVVLDKYKNYEEFMESEDCKLLVTEFFSTVPCMYELCQFPHAPKGIFSDKGDFKKHF